MKLQNTGKRLWQRRRRPARVRGARIETRLGGGNGGRAGVAPRACAGRGLKLSKQASVIFLDVVAPRACAGRGLKRVSALAEMEMAASPRARARGAD